MIFVQCDTDGVVISKYYCSELPERNFVELTCTQIKFFYK